VCVLSSHVVMNELGKFASCPFSLPLLFLTLTSDEKLVPGVGGGETQVPGVGGDEMQVTGVGGFVRTPQGVAEYLKKFKEERPAKVLNT
jgi:hypothetical protein